MSREEDILQSIIDGGDPAALEPPQSRGEVLLQAVHAKVKTLQTDVTELQNTGVDTTARAGVAENTSQLAEILPYDGTVLTVGTGKTYSNLSDAIAACVSPSKSNRYTIYVYEGTYDVFATLTAAELAGIGIEVPDYVNIVGVGDRKNIILKGELPNDTTYALSAALSTINISKNNKLANLTITAKNCRYAVHCDNSNTTQNIALQAENCEFIHYGCADGLWNSIIAWGEGTSSGSKYLFKNCRFAGAAAYTTHNNYGFDVSDYHQFDNCDFDGTSYSMLFNSLDSVKTSCVVLNGCNLNNDMVLGIGAGADFGYSIRGSGNNPINVVKNDASIPDTSVALTSDYALGAWVDITLTNSWAGYYCTASYRVDSENRVKCRGLIQSGSANSVAFQFPAGLRPTGVRSIACGMGNGAVGVIEVGADGNVTVKSAPNAFISLDNIDFYAD